MPSLLFGKSYLFETSLFWDYNTGYGKVLCQACFPNLSYKTAALTHFGI